MSTTNVLEKGKERINSIWDTPEQETKNRSGYSVIDDEDEVSPEQEMKQKRQRSQSYPMRGREKRGSSSGYRMIDNEVSPEQEMKQKENRSGYRMIDNEVSAAEH